MGIDRTVDFLNTIEGNQFSLKESLNNAEKASPLVRNRFSKAQKKPTPPNKDPPPIEKHDDNEGENITFLSEATKINMHLGEAAGNLATLRKYKSNQAMAAMQRVLDLSNQRILELTTLQERLAEQQSTARGSWMALFRADVAISQEEEHRLLVIKFLTHRSSSLMAESYDLKEEKKNIFGKPEAKSPTGAMNNCAGEEKSMATLHTTPSAVSSGTKPPREAGDIDQPRISDSQMLMLLGENDQLMREYAEMHSMIVSTHADINEISRLQTTLQEHIVYQTEQIERLFDEAHGTIGTIQQANVYLSKAGKSQSASVRLFIAAIIFMSILLLLLHSISD